MKKWLASVLAPFRHLREEEDLKAELQVHLELQAEDAAVPRVFRPRRRDGARGSNSGAARQWLRMYGTRSF